MTRHRSIGLLDTREEVLSSPVDSNDSSGWVAFEHIGVLQDELSGVMTQSLVDVLQAYHKYKKDFSSVPAVCPEVYVPDSTAIR